MTDMEDRFRSLDRVQMPDLWGEATLRAFAEPQAAPEIRTNYMLPLGLATAAVAMALIVGLGMLWGPTIGTPAVTPTPSPSAAPPSPSSPASASERPSPGPSVSERPSPSPGFSRFSSTIHGISIDYPSGWQIRRATEPWTEGELNFDSPAADVIFHPTLGERVYLALASRPSGNTQADQIDLLFDMADVCGDGRGGGGGSFVVDGASAFDWYCGNYEVAITTFDGRGYLILMVLAGGEPGLRETYDFDWIQAAIVETVDLRPEEAVD